MGPLERDFYEERRRRWRRSAFWRGFVVAALIAIVVVGIIGSDALLATRDHVARYHVRGLITDDPARDKLLADLAEDENARAVVLRINSPGGTTAGSEALYASIRAVAEEKPVVAVMGEVAASGGYMVAVAADHIIGRANTLTGSIGAIMEYPDLTEVLDRLGIGVETVRSSTLKGEPSPFRPTNAEARARDEAIIEETYEWFRGLVGERRGIEGAALDRVANGGVFTGRLALDAGLIDEIGGETEALAWLESREPALEDLPLREWTADRDEPVFARFLGRIAASGGILGEISFGRGPKLYSLGP